MHESRAAAPALTGKAAEDGRRLAGGASTSRASLDVIAAIGCVRLASFASLEGGLFPRDLKSRLFSPSAAELRT